MGGAILRGVLDAAFSQDENEKNETRPVSNFVACTKTASSAARLKESIPAKQQRHVKVMHSQEVPVQVMMDAKVIVLGFKPYMAEGVLSAEGVKAALAGKIVISLLAGQTTRNLARIIESGDQRLAEPPAIVKVNPNMAAQFRQSMTIIETPEPPVPASVTEIVDWIFTQVGWIKYLPESQMNLGSIVAGAGLAIMSIPIDGILDGCVAEGLRRSDALELTLRSIRGLSAALEAGISPSALRESISSPRGSTIQSLLTLERAASRADYAEAIISGTQHWNNVKK